jgi:predicted 2-oxoglutarate/Fe(II)-dependent dioxygenase YbiX
VRLFVGDAFFDRDTCQRIREAMDGGVADAAEILDDDVRLETEVRHAASIEVDDGTLALVEAAIDAWRERIGGFHARDLTSREGAGFLRYPSGGFYRLHRDRATSPAWPDAARRQLALVIFLNDDFTGGELRLFPDDGPGPATIVPRAGTLVAFDAATLHEVLPVAGGSRDTIVDWFY